MLTKIDAYKCPNGHLETDPLRAFAWKLSHLSTENSPMGSSTKLDFSECLWIMKNRALVKQVIEALEKELEA
jgi:hypothetical protein